MRLFWLEKVALPIQGFTIWTCTLPVTLDPVGTDRRELHSLFLGKIDALEGDGSVPAVLAIPD